MTTHYACSPQEVAAMDTAALRSHFLLENLFLEGHIQLAYTHYDRMIAGGVVPVETPIALGNDPELKADFFLERREIGIINLGGNGRVLTANSVFELQKLDCVYLGKNTQKVSFETNDPASPARFFLISTPAHREYPNQRMTAMESTPVQLGEQTTANMRTIYKYIHPDGIQSCQLVMGLTILQDGNVWNTMPPHTHDRRSEIYCYFDIQEGHRVLHIMGRPDATRSLWVGNGQTVLSPPWSVHAGCGTKAYAFIWAMGGENQSFADMDFVNIPDLR